MADTDTTLADLKAYFLNKGTDLEEITKKVTKEQFCCDRETHDPKLCGKGCQHVLLQELLRSDVPWHPSDYPEGTYLRYYGLSTPSLKCFHGSEPTKVLHFKGPCEIPIETLNIQCHEDSQKIPASHCNALQ